MTTPNPQFLMVEEFNRTFGHAVRSVPTLTAEDIPLRHNIFTEEVEEIEEALAAFYEGDMSEEEALVEVADALADTLVTLYGLAQAVGIPITEVFDVVHASNMSKAGPDGKPVYYTDGPKAGKVAKGPNYWNPKEKIAAIVKGCSDG